MSKYSWAVNQQKLQRAIEKARIEQQPADKVDARIREIYVSYGGLIQAEVSSPVTTSHDTTNNLEDNKTATEIQPGLGKSSGTDDMSPR